MRRTIIRMYCSKRHRDIRSQNRIQVQYDAHNHQNRHQFEQCKDCQSQCKSCIHKKRIGGSIIHKSARLFIDGTTSYKKTTYFSVTRKL